VTEFSPQHVLALDRNFMQEAVEINLQVVEFEETEALENEADDLWREFNVTLDYAVRSGFCPEDTAEGWRTGFLNCGDHVDWKSNLLRILQEKCMPKGEALQDKAGDILRSAYLPIKNKLELERALLSASPQEKEELLEEAQKEIDAKKKQEDAFNKLVYQIQFAEVRQQYEKEFAEEDSVGAKKILDKLARQDIQSLRSGFEVVKPNVSQDIELVKQNLMAGNISEAKRVLNSIGAILNFSGEYTKLSRLIDAKEIEVTRSQLSAMQAVA